MLFAIFNKAALYSGAEFKYETKEEERKEIDKQIKIAKEQGYLQRKP